MVNVFLTKYLSAFKTID